MKQHLALRKIVIIIFVFAVFVFATIALFLWDKKAQERNELIEVEENDASTHELPEVFDEESINYNTINFDKGYLSKASVFQLYNHFLFTKVKAAENSVTIHFDGNGNENTSYQYADRIITKSDSNVVVTVGTTDTIYNNVNEISFRNLVSGHRYYKKGYILTHWNTQKDGKGQSYYSYFTASSSVSNSFISPSNFSSSDITLYAQWRPADTLIRYKGNGNTNTDVAISNEWWTNGNSYTIKNNVFEKTGYEFTGFKYNDKVYQPGSTLSVFNATMTPESERVFTPSGFDYSDFSGESNKYYYPQGVALYQQNGKKYLAAYYISSTASISKTRGNNLPVDTHYFVIFDYDSGEQVSIKKMGHYGHGNDLYFDSSTNNFYLSIQGDCANPDYNKNTASIIKFDINFNKVGEIALKNASGDRIKANFFTKQGDYWYAGSGNLFKYDSNFNYVGNINFGSSNDLWINNVGLWKLSSQGTGATSNWLYGARFVGPTTHNFVTIAKTDNPSNVHMFEMTYSSTNWANRREIQDFDFDSDGNLHIFSSGSVANNVAPLRVDQFSASGVPHTDFVAQWAPINYTITYALNGGNVTDNPVNYSVETATFTLKNPTRVGYTFAGWTGTDLATVTKTVTIAKGSIGNRTYTANWTADENTINYIMDDGINNENNPTTYRTGEEKTLLEPSKVGSKFDGWYLDSGYINKITKIDNTMTGDITLYAKWIKKQYTITFDSNGGSFVPIIEKLYEEEITEPTSPTKVGYKFVGWYSDETLTKLYTFTTMPAENITLYAKWTESENIIRYITNGGVNDESNPTTYTTGEEILLKEATRKGYTFKGWYSDEQFNNKVEKITAKMNEDMILYALWEANTCTITFNSNGGSIVPTIEKLYGEKIAEPDIPTKEGYKFAGWYSDENLTKLYTFTTMPAENMTLYAKWYVYYTIDYILDGGINNESNPISYLPGETKELKEPSKEGYVFAGWYLDPNYEQVIDNITSDMEGNITLYAKWQKGDLIVKVPITWAGIPLYMIISGVILLFISLGLYIYLKLDKKIKP